ncbi:MAG: hypothetical protein DRI34_02595 [Deltaproteobacteria bacterium]|nr:MAG: hypothetical protein DRI34_02595 [Deltaproteobacteria bacterium]
MQWPRRVIYAGGAGESGRRAVADIWQKIVQGQGGLITAVGIIGVFIALTCLYLFIAGMRRSSRAWRRRRRQRAGPAPDSASPPAAVPVAETAAGSTGGENDDEEPLRAAAAAAAFLQLRARAARAPAPGRGGPGSAWRMSGRLGLMQRPGRRRP